MSYKIFCDSPKCEKEAAIPESNMVPPGWILIKRATGGESYCSALCVLDGIRDGIEAKREPVAVDEVLQPPIEEEMRKNVPREKYDRTRRDILSPHRHR